MLLIEQFEDKITDDVCQQIKDDQAVIAQLPDSGFLYIERPLPYLCVYRLPGKGDDYLTDKLDRTEASYLVAPSNRDQSFYHFFYCLVKTLSDRFGAFMIIEIWSEKDEQNPANDPRAVIYGPSDKIPAATEALQQSLADIQVGYQNLKVEVIDTHHRHPEGMSPLLNKEDLLHLEVLMLGLKIQPFYVNPLTSDSYPLILRSFRQQLSIALKKTLYEFVRLQTKYEVTHFNMLGTNRLTERAREVDERLVKVSTQFPFLLLVTPTNVDEAWQQFQENDFRKPPVFHYRLIPVDPEKIKRELYNIPIDQIKDPTLAYLFRDKRDELDKMLTMLRDRGTKNFVYSSMQLYGTVDEKTLGIAEGLLTAIDVSETREERKDVAQVGAEYFARRAQQELDFLRAQYDCMDSGVMIRKDVSGLIVSEGNLLISQSYQVSKRRVEALIQHEIGTHVLTYQNGKAQPLKQLYSGVPGYETLQEGLAVLSEYLAGGLTNNRLRMLAARVVGVHQMVNGQTFQETFFLLTEKYRFAPRTAYFITMRIYRSGGLTKDAVYLKGLIDVLNYLKAGNELEDLLIGKIREDYIPIMQELIHRKILRPVPLRPRYIIDETFAFEEKRKKLKDGLNVFDMIN